MMPALMPLSTPVPQFKSLIVLLEDACNRANALRGHSAAQYERSVDDVREVHRSLAEIVADDWDRALAWHDQLPDDRQIA
jgi:hypothetical protein